MKLTSDQIAKLERFLTKCEETRIDDIAKEMGSHPSGVRSMIGVLRKLGIVPRRGGSVFVSRDELAAFRSWQASLSRAAE